MGEVIIIINGILIFFSLLRHKNMKDENN